MMTTKTHHGEQSAIHAPDLKTIKDMGHKVEDIARETIHDVQAEMGKGLTDEIASIEKKIRDNPMGAVGIAFAAGVIISYLFKRR